MRAMGASRQSCSPGAAVADGGAQELVAVAEDVGGDVDDVARRALGRVAAAVDHRLRALDVDARGRLGVLARGHGVRVCPDWTFA